MYPNPPPPPSPYPPHAPPPPRRGGFPWLLACGGGCGIAVLLGVIIGLLGWDSFCKFGMGSDLDEVRAAIQASPIPERDGLTHRVDRIKDRIRIRRPSFLKWVMEHDQRLSAIADDGVVQSEEVANLEQGLQLLEMEIGLEPVKE